MHSWNATAWPWRQEGWSALSVVAFTGFKGHVDIVVELLRLGADVHERNDVRAHHNRVPTLLSVLVQAGQTALYVAAWNGQFAVATELLRVGADPAEQDTVCSSSCVVTLRHIDTCGLACAVHGVSAGSAAAAAAAAVAHVSESICVWGHIFELHARKSRH